MDPNATLEMYRSALLQRDYHTSRKARNTLREWVSNGGFEPDWTADERYELLRSRSKK